VNDKTISVYRKQDDVIILLTTHTALDDTLITTMTVSHDGHYVAIGYQDGSIMVWHMHDMINHPHVKYFAKTHGSIKKLTFNHHYLLLSQSQYGLFWNTATPTATPGAAVLWDIYGHELHHFGNSIVDSIMSPFGSVIVLINASIRFKQHATHPGLSRWDKSIQYQQHFLNDNTCDDVTLTQLY